MTRMFFVNLCTSVCFHTREHFSEALTICARLPRGTTGRICRKSPPKTTRTPPNGESILNISRKDRSTHFCVVLPPLISSAAIPHDVTANAIHPYARTTT
ncbi:hypothetical protein O6H91_19G044600 [Diphasiastrum complanatum]|uniref:Uncharacterized protein n=1 Tax=Diphasiastrum complanatum TaxID=34168 RepID=A0ACC2AUP5_DIPCM|nr:hypothetical protein O6H91_19G044600 [Diphasiastrum complanatum]